MPRGQSQNALFNRKVKDNERYTQVAIELIFGKALTRSNKENSLLHCDDDQPAMIINSGYVIYFPLHPKIDWSNHSPEPRALTLQDLLDYQKEEVWKKDVKGVVFEDNLLLPGPAKLFFKNGLLHRVDGPAYVRASSERWYQKGKLHRDDGPAFIEPDGAEFYYKNGALQEEDREWYS